MTVADLVHLNAALNGTCAVFLVLGYRAIRRGRTERHRACMLAAVGVSAAFLVSYVVYHLNVGSVRFTAQGWVRPVYLTILFTHVILAAAIVPMVAKTLYHALRGQLARHRRLARWTWPLWMYVSVTGVIVYVMLYHLYPPGT